MAIQKINLGTEPHGVGGDSYRTANDKINKNFEEVSTNITNVDEKYSNTEVKITEEVARAKQVEDELKTNLEKEASRAVSAEANILGVVESESKARTAENTRINEAQTQLKTFVDSEVEKLKLEDTSIKTSLEKTHRYAVMSQTLGLGSKFYDKDGQPLSGGKVYTYESETSTPLDTYKDVDFKISNTNPIILDETGSADVFLKGTYRFRIFDKNETFIEEQESVNQTPILSSLVSEINNVKDNALVVESISELPTIKNPKNGLRVYVKSYHAGLGKGGGYFTYDSTKTAVNNKGTIINGWVKDYADRVTPYCFGVRDDEIDVAANTASIQMFFDNICDDTQDYNYDIGCNTFINKPVTLMYKGTKELEIPGRLSVRAREDIKDLSKPYAIHISGVRKWNFTGGFFVSGYTSSAGIKNLIHGVQLSRFRGGTINYIGGSGLEGFAVFYDSESNNNMSTINEITGSSCGRKLNMRAKRAYTFISNNSESPTTARYRTNIKIDFDELEQHLLYTTMLQIGGKLHVVMDYDANTKIASIYPGTLDGFEHTNELDFLYGGALYLRGKDSGEMSYQRLTATNCGICHADRAMYGSVGNRLTVQHSSIAYLVGNPPASVGGFGSQVNQPYFENTVYDLVSMSAAGGSVITSPIGLHIDRCTELVPPAVKENPLSKFILIGHVTATIGVGNFMNSTTVTTRTWSGGLEEIRTPEKVFLSAGGESRQRTLVLSMKHPQVVSMGLNSREVVFFGASGDITIKSDDGYLVNGQESVTIPAGFIPDGTMLKAVMFRDSKNWSLYFYEPQSSGIRGRISDNSKTDFIKRYHSSRSVGSSLTSAFTITPLTEKPAFVDINAVVKFRDTLKSNGFIKLKAIYKANSEGVMAWELLENYSSAEGSADIQIAVKGTSIDILARRGIDTISSTLYLEGSATFSNCSIDAL